MMAVAVIFSSTSSASVGSLVAAIVILPRSTKTTTTTRIRIVVVIVIVVRITFSRRCRCVHVGCISRVLFLRVLFIISFLFRRIGSGRCHGRRFVAVTVIVDIVDTIWIGSRWWWRRRRCRRSCCGYGRRYHHHRRRRRRRQRHSAASANSQKSFQCLRRFRVDFAACGVAAAAVVVVVAHVVVVVVIDDVGVSICVDVGVVDVLVGLNVHDIVKRRERREVTNDETTTRTMFDCVGGRREGHQAAGHTTTPKSPDGSSVLLIGGVRKWFLKPRVHGIRAHSDLLYGLMGGADVDDVLTSFVIPPCPDSSSIDFFDHCVLVLAAASSNWFIHQFICSSLSQDSLSCSLP